MLLQLVRCIRLRTTGFFMSIREVTNGADRLTYGIANVRCWDDAGVKENGK